MIRKLVGIMGPGETASTVEKETAYALGQAIAKQDWILLTGGRATGVMDAASRGAQSVNGLVIGILPGENRTAMSAAVDIPILTGMGSGRNVINILSSEVVVACGLGAGTLSEIALALKLQKPLVLIHVPDAVVEQCRLLAKVAMVDVATVEVAIAQIQVLMAAEE
ncbi:TIGR00725 family protein [Oscillatoria sp. CS-180]|uniref:TIGR00725 family protein n=1 Tax=Oscillatoria sp. CS-180 TaxID=3021720 RepID=UPI0023300026|nr:TIGR00725 family protein [Oscillatoria sp. CS-180]MDB9525190.1 TIGR00725 family protein [Oscillatoria sp. CS-180]